MRYIIASILIIAVTFWYQSILPMNQASDMEWPPLIEFDVVTKRAAVSDDVSAGRAVFVLHEEGTPISEPIDILLPQYAFHFEDGDSAKKPCIIIQAEHARDQRLCGAVMLPDRSFMVGQFDNFELLGTTVPQKSEP